MNILKALFVMFLFLHAFTASGQESIVTPLLQKDLRDIPEPVGLMVTVEYPPGASSSAHRHNAHTYVYVLEGSVIMQVEGGEPQILGPGDTFYETPDDIHSVSKNASSTESARILVFLVKRKDAPASVPSPDS